MSAIAKFSEMCGGKCTPLEEVGTRKLPEIVNIGKKQKLLCQYTGLLCDTLYMAKASKLSSGWVATGALALELYSSRLGNNIGANPQTLSKTVEEAVAEEKKRKDNQRKKDELLFFKVMGTNVEKMGCKTLFEAMQGLTSTKNEYHVRYLLKYTDDGSEMPGALVVGGQKKAPTSVESLLRYNGEYKGMPPKLPVMKEPLVVICPEKCVKEFPRLEMVMNEVKGKMPLTPAKVAAAKANIAKEQEAEKLKNKHSNSKMPETLPPTRKRKVKAIPLEAAPSKPPPSKKTKKEQFFKDLCDKQEQFDIDESTLGCDMI